MDSQDKMIERLTDVGVSGITHRIFTDPREALKVAFKLGVITSWSDNGRFYTVELPSKKVKQLKTKQVCSYMIDRILAAKDPIGETLEEKTPAKEEETQASAQEGEIDLPEYKPTEYEKQTADRLTKILKDRGLPHSGSKSVKIKRLKDHDKELAQKE